MIADKDEHIKTILSVIPEKPGCYQYFDENGTIIYVGKAKNLKRRVSSYFNKVHDSNKTRVLVKQIRDIKYIVVDTEEDALLLENNLIKQYRPRYNVLLKDDKTYPSIVVKNEYFPRVFQTRNIVRDGSQYYGPYPSLFTAKVMLQMLKELYPLRTCKYPLTPESIAQGRYKVCLEYHIKRCKGPCEGLQSLEEYQQNISEIKEILRGNISQISKHLYEEMQSLAAELKFEEAQKIKEKYEVIENYRSKSTVVTPMLHNIDVFTIIENDHSAYVNFMHIGNGAIVQAYTFEYKKRLDESKEELLSLGIIEMRNRFKSTAREIIVPFKLDMQLENVTFTIPQRGDKKKLLDLSEMNVKQFKVDRLKQAEKLNPEQRNTRILKEIQEALHLEKLPAHIECFDNSNIQGSDAVAANSLVVVVRNIGTVLCFGVASAGGILLGNVMGEGNLEKAKEYASKLLKLTVVTGAVGGLVVLGITPFVLKFASLNETAMHYLKYMLLINTYYIMGTAVNTTLIAGVFRAGGDTKFGLVCDTIDMWCYAVPLGFIAAFVFKLPVLVVYFLLCTDEFVKWPWVLKRYKSGLWAKNITRDHLFEDEEKE